MRKKTLFIALLVLSTAAQAQSDARVTEIRKLYAEVKQAIELKIQDGSPHDDMVVSLDYMAPGAGPIKDITHYYYDGEYDEEARTVVYRPNFITRKYNVGAMEFYEEFLFDDGSLVFYFCKQEDNETRYYWGLSGYLREDIKGERLSSPNSAASDANLMKDVFQTMIGRNN